MTSHKYHFCPRCYTTLVLIYDNHITCPFCGTSFTEGPIDTSQLINQAKNLQRKKNKSRLKELELATYN